MPELIDVSQAERSTNAWPGLAAWTLAYLLLGHLGIHYAAFPDSWLTLIWLPSGLGVMMACLYGQRALPWIALGSLLVNGPYILAAHERLGWPIVLVTALLFAVFDTLQCWISWRLFRDQRPVTQAWTPRSFLHFLVAMSLGPLLTCWMLILLYYSLGFAPPSSEAPSLGFYLTQYAMLVLSDAQGIFLLVPALSAIWLSRRLGTGLAWGALGILLLLPLPLLLGSFQATLSALLFPLVTVLIVRTRFLGAGLSVAFLGLSLAVLTAAGWNPIPLGSGVAAFSQWSLLLLSMGTPLLLLGIILEENQSHQSQLETRVAERTSELVAAHALAEAATARALESSRVKSEFLANMSHEIRTPLNSVLGFTELLGRLLDEPRQLKYLATIRAGGHALLTLINDILDLSKIEVGRLDLQYAPVDLHHLLEELLQIFGQKADEKQLELMLDLPETVPASLILDEIRLRQVLFNLVGNAIKFTESGYVRNSVASEPDPEDESRVELRLRIEDSGIGMPVAALESIFEAFRQQDGQDTRKYGGTGLGLAISRKLVQMMNGEIRVESQPGQGSVFSLRFSGIHVAAGERRSLRAPADFAWLKFAPARLLIVEDVAVNRELLRDMLSSQPFELFFAADGREGVELARAHCPDLILMDIRMPVMDGLEANRLLKADPETRSIPVIALTASVMRHEIHSLEAAGFETCLRKPIGLESIYQGLMRFLPSQSEAPPNPEPAPNLVSPPDPALQAVLPGLIQTLERELMEIQTMLLRNKQLKLLRKFAQDLGQLQQLYPLRELADYAESVARSVESFDDTQIDRVLQQYPRLLEDLRAMLAVTPALRD